LLMQQTGAKLVHVPYPGSPQAATDLVAGRVQVMFSPATAVIALVQGDKLKLLASAGAKRPSIVPDVPTMIEAGMPGFDTAIWFGLTAPAGTPAPVIDKLSRAVREAINSNEVIAAWRPLGVDPREGGAADLAALQENELKRWSEVAAAAGLKK
jgi:tripartite-type tricarboxylate transporter receptor subunit TctC